MNGEEPKPTEYLIQDALELKYGQRHIMSVPNTGNCLGWSPEGDLILVTNSHMIWEFEIKCSRSDFLSEFRDTRNQRSQVKRWKHRQFRSRDSDLIKRGPNRYYVVAPQHVCSVDELPDYAGFIEVGSWCHIWGFRLQEIKRAPLLHKEKASYKRICELARGLSLRFWQQGRRTR